MDVAPFESRMPKSVRAAIAKLRARVARDGWVSTGFQILRGHPKPMPLEVTGWLVGIAMFADDTNTIIEIMEREKLTAPAAAILDAFAAGVHAGVVTQKRQWVSIERIVGFANACPDALRDALPIALVSDAAVARGAALRLAKAHGARDVIEHARARADGKARKRLDEALAVLAPADATPAAHGERLGKLLAAYRATFDPALEAPIARAGAVEARDRPSIRAKSKVELESAWHARAERLDPGDVDVLLGTPWPGAWKTALERMEQLRKFPPDPRIAAAMPTIRNQHSSHGAQMLRGAATALERAMRGVRTGDAPAALLADAGGSAAVDLAAVTRSFHASPADLELRAVLADALQAAGDPRGEYIALELAIAAGRGDAAMRKRAAGLLAAHIDTWMGTVPGALQASRRFERGFLTAVHLKTNGRALLASVDDPTWCTVEELHLSANHQRQDEPHAALELLLARAPSLRTFVNEWWGLAELFGQLRGPFPRVRALGLDGWPRIEASQLTAFPELAMLGTSASALDPALDHLKAIPIATLLVFARAELGEALAAYAKTPTVAELRFVAGRNLEMEHTGWVVQVRRDDARAQLSWGTGRYAAGSLTAHVNTLHAAGRRDISVSLPVVGRAAAAAEATTLKLPIAAQPIDIWKP